MVIELESSRTGAENETSRLEPEYLQGSEIPGLVVIIPALDEAAGIFRTIMELDVELRPYTGKTYLVVNGNSTDNTGRIAHRLGAVVLEQNGLGKGDAIRQALGQVPENTKYVVLTDADFTYPAAHIPEMVNIIESDSSIGMVSGDRFGTSKSKELFKRSYYVGNRILGFVHIVANGIKMHDPLSGLRVVRYDLLRNWAPKSLGFDIEVELNHQIKTKGYSIREIPIEYRVRIGAKKLRRRDGLKILRRMFSQILA